MHNLILGEGITTVKESLKIPKKQLNGIYLQQNKGTQEHNTFLEKFITKGKA